MLHGTNGYRNPYKFGPMIVKLGQDFVIERHLITAGGTIGGIEGKNDNFCSQDRSTKAVGQASGG